MVSRRIRDFEESVIREMGRLSAQFGAINLAQGIPDAETPPELLEAARRAIADGFNQYPFTWGAPVLREAVARKFERLSGLACDPELNVTVCCGSTECMQAALLALVDEGDEVIVFQPYYENYLAQCRIAGARPVFVRLRPPAWTFDSDELARAFTDRTRAIIVNTPANPTGHVFTEAELAVIARLAVRHDVFALTDETYEHMIHADLPHVHLATLPGMAERTVTMSGLSKTFCVTGWRLGYAIAAEPLTSAIRKVHDFLTIGAPHPLQIAGAAALSLGDGYFATLRATFRRRRDLFAGYLRQAGFQPHVPDGAYYILAETAGIAEVDDVEFVRVMARAVGVAAVPSSCFHFPRELGRGMIRFMFAKNDQTLIEAGQRLVRLRDAWPRT